MGIIIAIVIVVALVPTAYSLAQRATISALKINFNRIELSDVDLSGTNTIGSIQRFSSSIESPSLQTLKDYQQVQASIATPETVALDLLVNTRYVFDIYFDVTNPSYLEAVIDRAEIKVSISDHQLPGIVKLAQQEKIAPGETKTIRLQGIAVSGKDIGNILVNTATSDFVLSFNFAINSYYPTLFGEVPVPVNVSLKTYVIPQKPTMASFSQVSYNENSYTMSFANDHPIPLAGKLQVGVLKGNFLCNPACFAPIDNGFTTFLRIKGSQIFDIQVIEYNDVKLSNGQTYVANVDSAVLRSDSKSAFIVRWVPNTDSMPYTLTTEIAGVSSTKTGEFNSSKFSTILNIAYNVVRNFGYVGSQEFVSARQNNPGTFSSISDNLSLPSQSDTLISLTASSYSVSGGDVVTFRGRLVDNGNGSGIANALVYLKEDRSLAIDPSITTVTTDSDGYFSSDVRVSASTSIYAIFEGSSNYSKARSGDAEISVASTSSVSTYQYTSITLGASTYNVVRGELVRFSGLLVTQNGQHVGNALINIKQDKSLAVDPIFVSGYTDSNGRFLMDWVADRTGNLDIYAVFEGSSNFGDARSQEILVRVSQP